MALFLNSLNMMIHKKNIWHSMYPHTCEHMCDIYINTYTIFDISFNLLAHDAFQYSLITLVLKEYILTP